MRAGYRDHKENYMCCYNEVEICQESAGAYPKSAIRIRNRSMIERSDIIVCCLQHSGGNTYKYIRYAEKLGKIVLNTGNGKFI
ncbi:MAG: hypothetical protein K2G36_06890 [Ruminococcus sp.]|nr:hypothetical protein [Ruminococcus sp.]